VPLLGLADDGSSRSGCAGAFLAETDRFLAWERSTEPAPRRGRIPGRLTSTATHRMPSAALGQRFARAAVTLIRSQARSSHRRTRLRAPGRGRTAHVETMRAIVQHAFGGPEVLELDERPLPEPIADRGARPGTGRRGEPGRLEDPVRPGRRRAVSARR